MKRWVCPVCDHVITGYEDVYYRAWQHLEIRHPDVKEHMRVLLERSRILSWLEAGPVCGTTMLRFHIPRYAARINELRRDGYTIVTRPCQQHTHQTNQVEYVLLEGQLELIP